MGVRVEQIESTLERIRELRLDCAKLFPSDKKLEFSLLVVEMLYEEAQSKAITHG